MTPPTRTLPPEGEFQVPASPAAWLPEHGSAVLGLLRRIAPPERGEDLLVQSFQQVHRQMLERQGRGKAPLDSELLRARLLLAAREVAKAEAVGGDVAGSLTVQDSDTFPMPGDAAVENCGGLPVGHAGGDGDPGASTPMAALSHGGDGPKGDDGSHGDSRPQRIRAAFDSLDTGERRLVRDVVLDGQTLESAAHRSELPDGEARSQLLAALRRFRAALGRGDQAG